MRIIHKTITVDNETHWKLRNFARNSGLSMSFIVKMAITEWLKDNAHLYQTQLEFKNEGKKTDDS